MWAWIHLAVAVSTTIVSASTLLLLKKMYLHGEYVWMGIYAFIIILGVVAISQVAKIAMQLTNGKCPFIQVMGWIGKKLKRD